MLRASLSSVLPAARRRVAALPYNAGLVELRAMSTGARAPPTRMSASEAFVETMANYKVQNVFGIVGSAFMDALDLFPSAGIRFISVQHEQNAAHMADGYARASADGKTHGVCIAQNGPGITNFVTAIAAAYWAHSPVVAITPEAGTATKGLGGFQELDQVPMFQPITKYQGHVNNASRMAEITGRAFDIAINERGPVQLNIPRDFFYHEANYAIPQPNFIEPSAGGPQSLAAAAELLASAKNPAILAGGGVVTSPTGVSATKALAEYLNAPVAVTYLHNDAFPKSHKLWMGPLGYQGSKAAMNALKEADVVVALGTRLGPFGTLPQYGLEYWPKAAKLIQVDLNARNLGLTRPADVGIQGDSGLAASELLARLQQRGDKKVAALATRDARAANIARFQREWQEELDRMTFGGTPGADELCKPRAALRALERALPADAIVSTDIGNICSVSNSYLRFDQARSFLGAMTFGNCGYSFPAAMGAKVARPERPVFAYVGDGAWGMSLNEVLTCVRENIAVTAVVFNNQQWGAEKKNQVLWFGDRYVGSNLANPSFAEVARAMGAEGIRCTRVEQIGDAVAAAAANQRAGKATVLEVMCTRELGDPFRRDAMRLPQRLLAKYQHTSLTSESATGQPTDIQVKPVAV